MTPRRAKLAGVWMALVVAAALGVHLAVSAMEVEVVITRALAGTAAAEPVTETLHFLRRALGYGS